MPITSQAHNSEDFASALNVGETSFLLLARMLLTHPFRRLLQKIPVTSVHSLLFGYSGGNKPYAMEMGSVLSAVFSIETLRAAHNPCLGELDSGFVRAVVAHCHGETKP